MNDSFQIVLNNKDGGMHFL